MKPRRIFLHHSASTWGSAVAIDEWHRKPKKEGGPGFRKIGYHWVILNGLTCPGQVEPWTWLDGVTDPGRPIDDKDDLEVWEQGAGVAGYNLDSLHVCMIGLNFYTDKQILSARDLIAFFCKRYNLHPQGHVFGHKEVCKAKPMCPNIDMDLFRDFLLDRISLKHLREGGQNE